MRRLVRWHLPRRYRYLSCVIDDSSIVLFARNERGLSPTVALSDVQGDAFRISETCVCEEAFRTRTSRGVKDARSTVWEAPYSNLINLSRVALQAGIHTEATCRGVSCENGPFSVHKPRNPSPTALSRGPHRPRLHHQSTDACPSDHQRSHLALTTLSTEAEASSSSKTSSRHSYQSKTKDKCIVREALESTDVNEDNRNLHSSQSLV